MSYTPIGERNNRYHPPSSLLSKPLNNDDTGDNVENDDNVNIHKKNNENEGSGSCKSNHDNTTITRRRNDDMNSDDPFYVFREDLYRKLELVDEGIAQYLHVVHHTDTSVNTQELKDSKKQLKRHIKNAERTFQDVQTTIQLVEHDRTKFLHSIDNQELYNRKQFLSTSHDRLQTVKNQMTSDAIKQKLLDDEKAKIQRRNNYNINIGNSSSSSAQKITSLATGANNGDNHKIDNSNSMNSNISSNHNYYHNTPYLNSLARNSNNQTTIGHNNSNTDDFIVDSAAKQSLLFRQQEDTLEDLEVAVTRVGYMADNINDEIQSQNKILDDMDEDLSDAEEKLGVVMGKLAKVLKTKSKWQLCTIIGLSVTAVILFFLVLYT